MTSPIRLLIALAGCLCAAALPSPRAYAQQRVVLLHGGPRAAELAEGLKVELAATGAQVYVAPSPSGDTPLLRAGAAQEAARASAAAFAIWVEQPGGGAGDLLRVVDPESDHVRDAPLPASVATLDARTFAAVAASLIAEHLDPVMAPAGPVRVRVHVETPSGDIEIDAVADGRASAESAGALSEPGDVPAPIAVAATTVPPPPPATTPADASAPAQMPRSGTLVSASLTTAFIATGGELGVGFYLGEHLRLDVFGMGVVHYVDAPAPAGTLGLDLTRVGSAHRGRFDIGGFAALLVTSAQRSTTTVGITRDVVSTTQLDAYLGVVAGGHIGWMWELSEAFAIGFRVAGGVSFVYDADAFSPTPFGMLSLRTEIAP